MTQITVFPSTTARHGLPLLVSGQVQKELFVNEALARIDLLLGAQIEAERAQPPSDPGAGQAWLVAAGAVGGWEGRDGEIAGWDGQQWTFCTPVDGMSLYDAATGQRLLYRAGWIRTQRPALPTGGTIVDTEARAAISAIIDILATVLLIPEQ